MIRLFSFIQLDNVVSRGLLCPAENITLLRMPTSRKSGLVGDFPERLGNHPSQFRNIPFETLGKVLIFAT